MHAHTDRDQFAPPRPPARLRAITLAVLVHAALIGALTWGVNWKNTADLPAVEAELWAAVPTQAAARAVEPPAPPPPIPEPVTPPPPPPPPVRAVQPPDTREADIAIEREKKRLEQEKKAREQQLEREKRERERKEDERRDRLEQEKKERQQKEREKEREREKEKEQREKQLAEQKKAEQDKQKKLAEDKRKADEAAKRKSEAEAKQLAEQREANLRRIAGMAGATGGETATGTAQRNAGPSGGYGGMVAAKVKPNIVYPDALSGNPRAEVEVRLSPDGTIVGKRLAKPSGNKAWDEAVLRALDKTETLPRDVGGRAPPASMIIGFSPQD